MIKNILLAVVLMNWMLIACTTKECNNQNNENMNTELKRRTYIGNRMGQNISQE